MDIRRIGNIPGEISQPQKKQKVDKSGGQSSSDRIEISDSARAAQEVRNLAKMAEASPDIRPERVKEVRQALAEGVLMSREATHRLAEKLADLL